MEALDGVLASPPQIQRKYTSAELKAGSPFAVSLQKNLKPGARLIPVMSEVAKDVELMTLKKQSPQIKLSAIGDLDAINL